MRLVSQLPISLRRRAAIAACGALSMTGACSGDRVGPAAITPAPTTPNCVVPRRASVAAGPMETLGLGRVGGRFTGEVAVTRQGHTAYTTTWGGASLQPGVVGNAVFIWDTQGAAPRLVDSLVVRDRVTTLGDVAISPDGDLLIVATELDPGRIVVFRNDPVDPTEIARFESADTQPGVHTAEIGSVNGRLYAFLAVNPRGSTPSKLVIVDLANPSAPTQVHVATVGRPFIHDTFVRDGILFLALWDDGLAIWDVGGGGKGGSPSSPVPMGSVVTQGGEAHNVLWFHDPHTGAKRYAFVGEEGPGLIGANSRGDIHVIDLCDPANPREVAFYHVDGAGPHNFVADEANGVLYAAYYNGGIRALDVGGDLSACSADARAADGRCDLGRMGRELSIGLAGVSVPIYVWGVALRDGMLYASDMLNGLWKLRALSP